MKKTGRVICCQNTQIIGNVEIKRIGSRCFKNDVIRAFSQFMHRQNKFNRKLCVAWT